MKYVHRPIISEDYLKQLNDEELRKLFLETRSFINKGRRKKQNTRHVEVDFCYIQQELNTRNYYRRMKRKNK